MGLDGGGGKKRSHKKLSGLQTDCFIVRHNHIDRLYALLYQIIPFQNCLGSPFSAKLIQIQYKDFERASCGRKIGYQTIYNPKKWSTIYYLHWRFYTNIAYFQFLILFNLLQAKRNAIGWAIIYESAIVIKVPLLLPNLVWLNVLYWSCQYCIINHAVKSQMYIFSILLDI